jgi:hypothetical protein
MFNDDMIVFDLQLVEFLDAESVITDSQMCINWEKQDSNKHFLVPLILKFILTAYSTSFSPLSSLMIELNRKLLEVSYVNSECNLSLKWIGT